MEEFFSIVFIIILVIWGILEGLEWIFRKIIESINLTFTFIYDNMGAHISVFVFVLFVSFLYINNDIEKKKDSENKSDAKKVPSRREVPIKFTKEYYGVNSSMPREEIKKILKKKYMEYNNLQTSTSSRVIKEAEEHKMAITKILTELS